jgi:GT2 family glycosyltransferase
MVSVILINYNTRALTEACIESVIHFTKNCNYEIILVDNASTECDPHYFKRKYPQIKLICSEKNLGFAGGNNLGIKHSEGEEILLLNSDAELLNDAISYTSQTLNKYPDAGIVTCKMTYPDGRIQHNCQAFPNGMKIWAERLRLHLFLTKETRGKIMQGNYFNYEVPGKAEWVWGTYFHFKKEILNDFPNKELNSDYFMYVEDMQWCFQAKKNGWDIRYEPKAKIIHHSGGSSGPRSEIIQKNYEDFINKNYSLIKKFILKTTGSIS